MFCDCDTLLVLCSESETSNKNENTEDDKGKVNRNHLELVYVLAQQRNFRVFRQFLADIYCIENLDFFVMVQYYRGSCESELESIENAINEKELELQQHNNQNISMENVTQNSLNNSGNSSGVTTPVIVPDTPIAGAVPPSPMADSKNYRFSKDDNIVDIPLPNIENTEEMEIKIAQSDVEEDDNLARATTMDGLTMQRNESEHGMPRDEMRLPEVATKFKRQTSQDSKSGRRMSGKKSSKLKLKGITRGGSKTNTLPRQRSIQSKNVTDLADAAKPYIRKDSKTGQESLEITKIAVYQPTIEAALRKHSDWKEKAKWIFNAYIPANSANCLNLSSKMRKQYIKSFSEKGLYQPNQTSRLSIFLPPTLQMSDMSRNLTQRAKSRMYPQMDLDKLKESQQELEQAKVLFDEAQAEVWKLMAQDSMNHFRNSEQFAKVMRFVDTKQNST